MDKIYISANKNKKNIYAGNMLLSFVALFMGVLSIMLFVNELDVLTYSGEVVYTFTFIYAFLLCYVHYKHKKLCVHFINVSIILALIYSIIKLNDILKQFNSLISGFSAGSAAVSDITDLMFIIAILLVIVFYIFEMILNNHFILSVPIIITLMASPFLMLSVSIFHIFAIVVYQIMFYVINRTLQTSKKQLYAFKNQKSIFEKCIAIGAVVLVATFIVSEVVLKFCSEPMYSSVSGLEGIVYNIANRVTGRASDIYMDGRINTGNNYQTGAKQLIIKANKKPTEDIYLYGFNGGQYENGTWNKADDLKICNVIDMTKKDSYQTKVKTSQLFENMYYMANIYTQKNAEVASATGKAVKLNITFVSDKTTQTFYPYCNSIVNWEKQGNIKTYSTSYYQQSDMASEWQAFSELSSAEIEDYINLQSYYKSTMRPYYLNTSNSNTPKLSQYVSDNPQQNLEDITTFIIYTLLSNTKYTRTPGLMMGNSDVADTFLFSTKKGYCVHYATVATLMYQMYGIPARYVAGFHILADDFEENENGEWTVDVTDKRQHAWTEIFIDNYGWVPVDVTPSTDGSMAVSYPGYNMDTFEEVMQAHNWNLNSPTIYEKQENDTELVRTFSGALKAGARRFFSVLINIVEWGVVIGALLVIILSPFVLIMRRKKLIAKRKNEDCTVIYNNLVNMLHKSGYLKEYTGTEEEFALKIVEIFNTLDKRLVKRAAEIAVMSEFAQYTADDDERKLVYKIYKQLADIIYQKADFKHRFVLKYIYGFM